MARVADRVPRTFAYRAVVALLALLAAGPAPAARAPDTLKLAVNPFDHVHYSGAGRVVLSQGRTAQLALRGEPAVIEAVKVQVRGGGLYIETPASADGLEVDLQVARLTAFVSQGNARVTGDDLDLDALRLDGVGTGSFQMRRLKAAALEVRGRGATGFDLTGQVGAQVIDLSGTGSYRAGELVSDVATVSVEGASAVRIWAERLLDLRVAGAADIRYTGSPRVEQQITGIASILRIPRIAI